MIDATQTNTKRVRAETGQFKQFIEISGGKSLQALVLSKSATFSRLQDLLIMIIFAITANATCHVLEKMNRGPQSNPKIRPAKNTAWNMTRIIVKLSEFNSRSYLDLVRPTLLTKVLQIWSISSTQTFRK